MSDINSTAGVEAGTAALDQINSKFDRERAHEQACKIRCWGLDLAIQALSKSGRLDSAQAFGLQLERIQFTADKFAQFIQGSGA